MEAQKPVLRLLCLRHGQTRYTGVLPDLTEEGQAKVKRAALVDVSYWIRRNKIASAALRIVHSPAARAEGTASIIAEAIRHPHPIVVNEEIGPMAWRDPIRCKEALGGLFGRGYIDYETEPTFGDSSLFETQSEMRERRFAHLARRIDAAARGTEPQCEIEISHYEFLCPLTAELFGVVASESTALQYVEPIELAFYEMGNDVYYVSGRFRNLDRSAAFSLRGRVFTAV